MKESLKQAVGLHPIRKRVIAMVEKRIQEAETEYSTACVEIDKGAKAEVERVKAKAKHDKVQLADKLVESILGSLS